MSRAWVRVLVPRCTEDATATARQSDASIRHLGRTWRVATGDGIVTLGSITSDLYPSLSDVVIALVVHALMAMEDGAESGPWRVWGDC